MSEGEQSIFSSEANQQIGQAIGGRLLDSESYADLKVDDLVSSGLVGKNESFPEGISRLLGLNKRIAGLSLDVLCQRIPPPTDGDKINAVVPNLLVSEADERAVRLHALNLDEETQTNPVAEAHDAAKHDLQTLSLEVLNAAKSEANKQEVPESIRDEVSDPQEVLAKFPPEQFMNIEPTIVRVPQVGHCFALPIPSESKSTLSMFLPPSLDDYLIVLDSELNSQLADSLFENPNVLRFFLLDQIKSSQQSIVRNLESKFRDIAIEKYPQLEARVETVTSPLANHVYDLLEQEVDQYGEVYVTEVLRDHYDRNALLGKAEARQSRVGSESFDNKFTIRKNEAGGLYFEWPGNGFEWETDYSTDPPTRKMVCTPVINSAIVNRSEDGKLVYSDIEPESSRSPEDHPDPESDFKPRRLDTDSEHLERLFQKMSGVFSLEQLKQLGNNGIKDAEQLVNRLNQVGTLHELFSELRSTQIYPKSEYLFSKDPGLYVVDAFNDPAKAAKAKYN
jgi:hypothetical protein